ncbi:MAG: hypothetical protein ACJAR0_001908 [Candidatus Azotimanducaceae bacterium]|jgi:hypothetical protein
MTADLNSKKARVFKDPGFFFLIGAFYESQKIELKYVELR